MTATPKLYFYIINLLCLSLQIPLWSQVLHIVNLLFCVFFLVNPLRCYWFSFCFCCNCEFWFESLLWFATDSTEFNMPRDPWLFEVYFSLHEYELIFYFNLITSQCTCFIQRREDWCTICFLYWIHMIKREKS